MRLPRIRFDGRLRLFPAVAGAAGALLLIKAIQIATEPPAPAVLDLTAFGMIDPATTGSTAAPKKEKKEEPPLPPAGTVVNLDAPPVSPAEKELLERLAARRKELEKREQDLDTRENLLKAADKKIEEKIGSLKTMEQATSAPAKAADNEQQQGLKNLVIMYEAMKPKDAARVFEKLGMPVLVPVVQAMNPRKVSEILAAMAPEIAGKLTVELAAKSLNMPAPAPVQAAARPLPAGELPAIEPKKN